MSSISPAELDARFLAEERTVDALARTLALRRTATRFMATTSEPNAALSDDAPPIVHEPRLTMDAAGRPGLREKVAVPNVCVA